MKTALLSVSDKTNIIEFAKNLQNLDYQILSTGGTYKVLKQNDINVIEVSSFTGESELFEGRVKTLSPKIHGGILYKRGIHDKEAQEHNISKIDLVCVNLYPFKQTIHKTDDFDEIIENIDIGGPAMLRSAAKNYKDVLVVCDPNDYDEVIQNLKSNNDISQKFMIKAFEHTANYDSIIANFMNKKFNNGFGDKHFIVGKKVFNTRYGENPHQKGALYEFENFFTKNFKILKGEPSFNNLTDINGALKIAAFFKNQNAVCIVKHANPCGFAIKQSLLESYNEALKCDIVSAYGGVVAINGVLEENLAKKINEIFVEVIIAADVTKEALKVFENKKRIKIFSQESKSLNLSNDYYNFKHVDGGFVLQESDFILEDEVNNASLKSKVKATKEQMQDLKIAYVIAAFTKSNCLVYVKNSTLVGIGMGMTSRVDAGKCALQKAKEMGLDVSGCVLASEAFFPFRDSIDLAYQNKVSAIIQPGGSIRDEEVINAANEHEMALYFSHKRHFLH